MYIISMSRDGQHKAVTEQLNKAINFIALFHEKYKGFSLDFVEILPIESAAKRLVKALNDSYAVNGLLAE